MTLEKSVQHHKSNENCMSLSITKNDRTMQLIALSTNPNITIQIWNDRTTVKVSHKNRKWIIETFNKGKRTAIRSICDLGQTNRYLQKLDVKHSFEVELF